MSEKKVIIIGGGVAGLSAAIELAAANIESVVIEKSHAVGGHAINFACKAADECVKCGACIVREKLKKASESPNIEIIVNANIKKISGENNFTVFFETEEKEISIKADTIILAIGFKTFSPKTKPYGYNKFDNVITNLEFEKILHKKRYPITPSNQNRAKKIAFIQCVGSRDIIASNTRCSRVCCGVTIRLAMLIDSLYPDTESTFFYIDVQNFGKDFATYYEKAKKKISMKRSICADIFETEEKKLIVTYFDKNSDQSEEFDLVVLSVGMMPPDKEITGLLGIDIPDTEFIAQNSKNRMIKDGVFVAGSARGPMNIEESAADAGVTALDVINYIGIAKN